MSDRKIKILAISSGGGHWIQLKRVELAFEGAEVVYATVGASGLKELTGKRFYNVPDATRWNKFRLLWQALKVLLIILNERPGVIITTGAAPGYFAILFGYYLGCKTIWIDSMANAEELSLSGKKAGKYASLWLTQWEHLSSPEGPHYGGMVI